jgi:hypothetical protein
MAQRRAPVETTEFLTCDSPGYAASSRAGKMAPVNRQTGWILSGDASRAPGIMGRE